MKRIYIHILAVAAAVALGACSKVDIEPYEVRDYPTFSALIDAGHSRAADDYWENGDKIGISGGRAINVCHLTQVNDTLMAENPDQQIFFMDSNPVEFTAYYPFNSSRDASTGLISFSTADQANQKDFDFLWAKGEGSKANPSVQFTFTHRMSKISLTFVNGNNMDVSTLTRCRLNGVLVEGTFDTITGFCEPNESMPTASTTMTLTEVEDSVAVTPYILIPQTVAGPVKLELYDLNNQYFVSNLTIPDNELEWGTNYKYTITVNKTGLQVTGASLSDWIEKEDKCEASSADD